MLLLHQLPHQLHVAFLDRPSGYHPAAFARDLSVFACSVVGCDCQGPPGAILPQGFEVIRSIEADLSVEMLSFSVSALTVRLVGYERSAVMPVLPTTERRQRKKRKLSENIFVPTTRGISMLFSNISWIQICCSSPELWLAEPCLKLLWQIYTHLFMQLNSESGQHLLIADISV